jgi:hypothetical protein
VAVCLGEASNTDTGGGNAGSLDAAKTNPNSTLLVAFYSEQQFFVAVGEIYIA